MELLITPIIFLKKITNQICIILYLPFIRWKGKGCHTALIRESIVLRFRNRRVVNYYIYFRRAIILSSASSLYVLGADCCFDHWESRDYVSANLAIYYYLYKVSKVHTIYILLSIQSIKGTHHIYWVVCFYSFPCYLQLLLRLFLQTSHVYDAMLWLAPNMNPLCQYMRVPMWCAFVLG